MRELAIELAPLVRVNGVAPATVVQGSAMFPRDRVIGSLAKYNIPYNDDEATESLVNKLAQFYADRTLTKAPITPADQAEAYFLLVTQPPQQDHRPGDHRGRRPARGVPAVKSKRHDSRFQISTSKRPAERNSDVKTLDIFRVRDLSGIWLLAICAFPLAAPSVS